MTIKKARKRKSLFPAYVKGLYYPNIAAIIDYLVNQYCFSISVRKKSKAKAGGGRKRFCFYSNQHPRGKSRLIKKPQRRKTSFVAYALALYLSIPAGFIYL
ncbi:hypothetical protein [Marinococcus halotolerans]|uniref:hypothetical protein n=1 Tax=Marinococcus halotolerans TaxID=301092 RepID=UPI0012EC0388|nr:hypothetical protein [Marinococcus halotolerans]